jgi:hypothetical protein
MGFNLRARNVGADARKNESHIDIHRKEKQKSLREFKDVWYRPLLRPLAYHRSFSYYDSFTRRVLRPVGIPVEDLRELHETFKPSHRIYSPLFGMIFNYNNFIDNAYKFGDSDETAVQLIRLMFHLLPGGDIHTTHIGSCPAAHFSAGIIGRIFETFENLKCELSDLTVKDRVGKLSDELVRMIINHPDYVEEIRKLHQNVQRAEEHLRTLEKREKDASEIRHTIKILEGDEIKRSRHVMKRLQNELQNASECRREELYTEIKRHNDNVDAALKKVVELRKLIVTSNDFKVARKTIRRAETAVVLEEESRLSLTSLIALSFCSYDLEESSPMMLPKFTTTVILQAYIWRKFNSIEALVDYFQSMDRIHALNVPLIRIIESLRSSDSRSNVSRPQQLDLEICKVKTLWTPRQIERAVVVSICKPDIGQRVPVVPFSYITWAAYSEFPDCGETALRNLMNQLLYNSNTKKFDVDLLFELREKHFPKMNRKLIEFYTKNSNPMECIDPLVAKEWISTVSGLNAGRNSGPMIKYRRELQQQNIASPLSNVLRVFNALMGIEPLDMNRLEEVVRRINELRGDSHQCLQINSNGISDDGFGTVSITDGKVIYELQSYKPVHFAFVQTGSMRSGRVGQSNYRMFRNLMAHASSQITSWECQSDLERFEQLALASIFVPYHLQRMRLEPLLKYHIPLHLLLYFADNNNTIQQKRTIRFVEYLAPKLTRNPMILKELDEANVLSNLVDRIVSYTLPTFIPTNDSES